MRFQLKAVDSQGQVVALALDAADEASAHDLARHDGYSVLTITRRQMSVASRDRRPFPTTLFSIELLALLEAGLNVVEALQALAEKQPGGDQPRVLMQVLDSIYRGESLSQAVSRLPQAFPPLYRATIASSERTGNLKEALARYIAYQEELDRVRKKVVSALLYPAILAVVGGLVLLFLMFYVVPRFARVYEDISAGLPFFSSLLLTVGSWIGHHGLASLLGLAAVIGAGCYALSTEAVRAALLRRLWQMPRVGEHMKIYQLARFYRTVGMLLRSGIPALQAFEMVSGLLAPNLRGQLAAAIAQLREGRAISAALGSAGLTTPVSARMLRVGEQSGQMGELMERIARFHDEETARFVDTFTRVFEPLLMAVLGIAVGLIVVLMYMPIFELAGSLQ
jgi:general secretion pathway protein F